MDQYLFFAVAGSVLVVLRYGTYLYTVYQGQTKPHAFTWLLLGSVSSIGAWAQFELNGGPSAWVLGLMAATCLLIALLAFFVGYRDYKKSDWAALIICFMAIPLWKATDNPVLALVIVVFIDFLSYWPTIRKSFNRPQTEPPISAFISGIRYLMVMLAVPDPTWENIVYPLYLMLIDWAFAVYIVIRRYQMGYPLHEYVQKKEQPQRVD